MNGFWSPTTITWLTTAAFHPIFGEYLDRTRSYNLAVGVMGWLPMVALLAILLLWKTGRGKGSGLDEDGSVAADRAYGPVGSH